MTLPHTLTTAKLKDLLKVKFHSGLQAILSKHDIDLVCSGLGISRVPQEADNPPNFRKEE